MTTPKRPIQRFQADGGVTPSVYSELLAATAASAGGRRDAYRCRRHVRLRQVAVPRRTAAVRTVRCERRPLRRRRRRVLAGGTRTRRSVNRRRPTDARCRPHRPRVAGGVDRVRRFDCCGTRDGSRPPTGTSVTSRCDRARVGIDTRRRALDTAAAEVLDPERAVGSELRGIAARDGRSAVARGASIVGTSTLRHINRASNAAAAVALGQPRPRSASRAATDALSVARLAARSAIRQVARRAGAHHRAVAWRRDVCGERPLTPFFAGGTGRAYRATASPSVGAADRFDVAETRPSAPARPAAR